jgi:MoxR-like ATPase
VLCSGEPVVASQRLVGHAGVVNDRPLAASDSPSALAAALRATGYLADDGLATATFLAMRMNRPLFCEGEPGTGKTALAQALAEVTGAELIRLQCHDGIDAYN